MHMPKAKKTKSEPKGKTEPVAISQTQSIGPMSKEEWCKANDIARPGSNHAQTEYAKYLASIA